MKRALAFVGIYMMTRGSDAGSRYILDDDWQIGATYPFPMGVCLQTGAAVTLMNTHAEYTYFECDSTGQTVTKYKWGFNEVDTIDSGFDCMDATNANQVDSRANVTTIAYDASLTACDPGYFNCTGDDNYATTIFSGVFGDTQYCPASPLFSLTTSVATGVCYCNMYNNTASTASYRSIECDPTQATTYNWTDNQCTAAGNPDSTVSGVAYECTPFPEPLTFDYNGLPITVSLFSEMSGCTAAGEQIIMTTDAPTSAPTEMTEMTESPSTSAPSTSAPSKAPSVSPTTSEPTNSPSIQVTVSDGNGAYTANVVHSFAVIVMACALCTLFVF